MKLSLKQKFLGTVLLIISASLVMFLGFPRATSMLFSYKKSCKVLRVEAFSKGNMMAASGQQLNKFSIICDDGFICRAEDTGFAAVKNGDEIQFRGFPEFANFEGLGKWDHAQVLFFKPTTQP